MSDRKTTRQERGVIANWKDSWLESERKDLEKDLKNGGGSSYKRTILNAIKDEQNDRRKGR